MNASMHEGSTEGRSVGMPHGFYERSACTAFCAAVVRLYASARRSPGRWIAVPILGVPATYGGYNTMLSFCQTVGLPPSLWWHLVAALAGAASGLAAITRFRA